MVRQSGHDLAEHLCRVRPELSAEAADLLAWSVLAVLMSPSFHRLDLPRPALPAVESICAGLLGLPAAR